MQQHTAVLVQTSTVGVAKGLVQITGLRPIDHEGHPRAKISVDMLPVPVTDATVIVLRVTNEKTQATYSLPFSFTTKETPGASVTPSVTLAYASHPDHHRLVADMGVKELRLIVEIQ